jgi:hypothetical protein
MPEINKEVIVIFLLILLALWVIYPFIEGFDAAGGEFLPVGAPKYGLRGDLLRQTSWLNHFLRPDRRIRISLSGGDMWESNTSPKAQGIKDCKRIACPPTPSKGYDNIDQCWQCGTNCRDKLPVPDMWPH